MKPVLLLAVAALSLAACNRHESADKSDGKGASISIAIDDKDDGKDGASDAASDATSDADAKPADTKTGALAIDGDTESGQVAVTLPGGFGATVKVPKGMADNSHFDIDGVGLYPGAKVGSVNVRAVGGGAPATVKIGFTASADAAAVADWYQQQFDAKKISVTRRGETLTGKTSDGDDFTLAMEKAATGTRGVLTIVDAKEG